MCVIPGGFRWTGFFWSVAKLVSRLATRLMGHDAYGGSCGCSGDQLGLLPVVCRLVFCLRVRVKEYDFCWNNPRLSSRFGTVT